VTSTICTCWWKTPQKVVKIDQPDVRSNRALVRALSDGAREVSNTAQTIAAGQRDDGSTGAVPNTCNVEAKFAG
jgi:hypothetical protein